jgi:cell division transport system permease protein
MVSVSLIITFVIRDTSNSVRSKINLSIYFRDDAVKDDSILALSSRIQSLPDVSSVTFINKERALEIFRRLPINENIKQPINQSYNPLPRSLEIFTNDVETLSSLQTGIEQVDIDKIICSECVSLAQNKEVVDQLVKGTRALQQIGWLLSIFFGLIAIFNVSNIIKLTIAARADEIEIMRFVGASNLFSRGPFIMEGIFYGLLGTIITSAFLPLLIFILSRVSAKGFNGAFTVLGTSLSSYVIDKLPALIVVQLAIGLGLGVIVSLISIRRYLKA